MRPSLIVALLPIVVNAVNAFQCNDDGWAEINIGEFYHSLTDVGFNSIVSAPPEDQSGTGSSDEEPDEVGKHGCHHMSCPAHSPPYRHDGSEPTFNVCLPSALLWYTLTCVQYANSFPVTATRHGIDGSSIDFFSGRPDIAVARPNAGENFGSAIPRSGTIGAAVEAAKLRVPAIAFNGRSGHKTAWNKKHVAGHTIVYTDLATTVAQALTNGGAPFLPEDT